LKKSELGARYGIDGIPRHLRRRTRSHNPYKHRRRPNATKQAVIDEQMEVVLEPATAAGPNSAHPPFTNRKMRRRPSKLAADCLSRASWSQADIEIYKGELLERNDRLASGSDDGASPPPLPPRRLETHLWHAKRLAMVSTWNGWVLPEGDSGRGRGTRAFTHRLATGAVMHDSSYWCPLLLSGQLEALTSCLNLVLDPEIVNLVASKVQETASKTIGWEVEAMLHEMNHFPAKALTHVKIMALPTNNNTAAAAVAGGSSEKEAVKLCIWVHGAGVSEAYNALKAAVRTTIENTTMVETTTSIQNAPDSGSLSLMVGDARRIEIRGATSDEMLLNALFKHSTTKKDSSTPCLPHEVRSLRPGEATLLALPDPRLTKPITLGSSSCRSLLDPNSSNKVDLNVFSHNYPSPLTEAAISQARKEARRQLVVIEETTTPTEKEEEASIASLQGPTHCGAIIIRGYKGSTSSTGWSIIIPPGGWVMPLWVALAFSGCRAAGQREWRWLHTLDHRAFFPHDVPDTAVYDTFIEKQQEIRTEIDKKRPFAKRFDLPNVDLACVHLSELNIDHPDKMDRVLAEVNVLSTRLLDEVNIFVARSESIMLKSLFGISEVEVAEAEAEVTSGSLCKSSGLRPVAKALASGKLQWAPRKAPKNLAGDLCLVEAAVNIINQGAINEGAVIFVIWKEEGHLSQGQPCHLDKSGAEEANKRYIEDQMDLIPIGLVTSPAPQGTGRATASMAVVTAAAFWRLRSLQFSEYKRDRGTVEAWIQNPRSSVIYPVRLSLLMEKRER
jgi:hypothetical protein